jgi:hypothetical protein
MLFFVLCGAVAATAVVLKVFRHYYYCSENVINIFTWAIWVFSLINLAYSHIRPDDR